MHSEHSQHSILSNINAFFVYGMVVFVPLFFLPFLENAFDTAKYVWIVVSFVIAAVSWAIYTFQQKEFSVKGSTFLLPQVLSVIAIFLSSLFSPLKMSEDFSSVLGIMFFLGFWIIFSSTLIKKISARVFIELLLSMGIVLSVISFLQVMGVGPTLLLNKLFNMQFPEQFQFSPTGSPLITLSYLLPVTVAVLFDIFSSRKWNEKVFEITGVLILLAAIGMHLFFMFPGKPDSPVLLPVSANWVIAVENLKQWKLMLFGYGPNNFVDAFTLYRPVSLNASLFWNVMFQTGSNVPLTLLVTTGLLGLFAWIFNLFQALRTTLSTPREEYAIAALVLSSFAVQLLLPPNVVLLSLQAAAIIVWIVTLGMHQHHSVKEMVLQFASLKLKNHSDQEISISPIIASAVGLMTLICVAIVLFSVGRSVIAEYFFVQAIRSITSNDGQAAYKNIQTTLRFNPERDGYHRTYAQTNYALANAISNKKDISDEDRKNVAQLMQQAIREARIAAGLNPQRSTNWKVMGDIYKSLIGSVEKADEFTVAAYVQAIQLSPTEPTLRVELGGIFYNAKNYDQASQLFEQAVRLKPDYANAYYNWAKTLEAMNRVEPAVAAYKQTVRLLEASADKVRPEELDLVKKELETAESKLAQAQTQAANAQQKAKITASPTPVASPTPTPELPSESSTPENVPVPTQSSNRESLLRSEPALDSNIATQSANP